MFSGTPYPIVNYVTCKHFSGAYACFLVVVITGDEPAHFSDIICFPYWQEAMKALIELLSMLALGQLRACPPKENYQVQVNL